MATLMEFAAMQLERNTGSRSAFEEDTKTDTRPVSVFWNALSGAKDGVYECKLLVIGAFGAGANTIEALLPDESVEQIGVIMMPELSVRGCQAKAINGVCGVWRSKSDASRTCAFVNISHKVAAERSQAFGRMISSCFRAERTIVLDQTSAKELGYTLNQVDEVVVRALVTDEEKRLVAQGAWQALVAAEEAMPPGGMMSGVCAGVLMQCQMREKAGVLCVSVTPDDGNSNMQAAIRSLAIRVRSAMEFVGGQGSGSWVRGDKSLIEFLREREEEGVGKAGGNPLYL